MKTDTSMDANFYGIATVGERGQIVIPAEARKTANIHPGDKVMVVGHPPTQGLVLLKMDSLKQFISAMVEDFSKLENRLTETEEEESAD